MKYGLIGEKLGHSFSKSIHEDLFGYEYELKEISPKDLKLFLLQKGFQGINVTIPYKELALSYCDALDISVSQIGALNTIVNQEGKLIGYNTDYYGLKFLLETKGIEIKGKSILILGSGGTSKTAKYLCKDLGAKEIVICSRKNEEGYISYDEIGKQEFDVLINTTPLGMYPDNDGNPISKDILKEKIVIDVVFNPLRTKLMQEALSNACFVSGGLLMLVGQASKAGTLFTKETKSTAEILKCYEKLYRDLENIVLIGMPSSGKTSVAKELAVILGKDFVDLDATITEKENLSISEIFERFGEEYFREIEEKVIEEVSKKHGLVIATGGGAILREKNVTRLKQNGKLVLLERGFDLIKVDENRPLLKNKEEWQYLYQERKEKYEAAGDMVVKNDGIIEETVQRILEELT